MRLIPVVNGNLIFEKSFEKVIEVKDRLLNENINDCFSILWGDF